MLIEYYNLIFNSNFLNFEYIFLFIVILITNEFLILINLPLNIGMKIR